MSKERMPQGKRIAESAAAAAEAVRPTKKKRIWLRVIVALLILFLLIAAVGAIAVHSKLGRIERIDTDQEVYVPQEEETFEQDSEEDDTIADEEIVFAEPAVEEEQLLADSDVVNIMLVGRDAQTSGERGRSDSMIILSLNRKTKQISLVSLMRDIYTQIPGYSNNRLNAAFSFGGYSLMDQTIEQNFGIDIDYNVGVNFEGFESVIDQLGGIDIVLNEAEVNWMVDYPGLVVGTNHLNGEEALAYARIRYVGTGKEANDFGRTYRQRMVITTVYKELMKKSWTEIWSIMDSIMDCLETDMSEMEMISLGMEAYNLGLDSLQSYRIPYENEYSGQTVAGMQVLVIDWDAARQHLEDWLYSDTPLADTSLTTAN